MGNVIQIKRGSTVPADGTLADGELGYNKTDGFLYIGVDNRSVKIKAEGSGGSSGILSLTQGGTGADLSGVTTDSIIVKGSSGTLSAKYPTVTGAGTNGGGAVYYTEQGTLIINTLPISKGGTGADLRNAATNSVIIKETIGESHKLIYASPPTNNSGALVSGVLVYDNSSNPKATKFIRSLPLTLGGTGANLSGTDVVVNSIIVKGSSSALSYVAPSSGAFYYDGSSLNFGTLSLDHGGTGSTTGLATAKKNAVIIKHKDEPALSSVRSTNGAFYSTAQDAAPVFGILPLAQGGTGVDLSDEEIAVDAIIVKGSDGTLSAKGPTNGAVFYTVDGTLSLGTLPLSKGGTGATTAKGARSNLGFGKELANVQLTTNTTSFSITEDISNYTFLLVQMDHANWTTMPPAFFLSPYALTSAGKDLQFQATHKDNDIFIGTVNIKKDSSKITFTRIDTSVRIIVYGII